MKSGKCKIKKSVKSMSSVVVKNVKINYLKCSVWKWCWVIIMSWIFYEYWIGFVIGSWKWIWVIKWSGVCFVVYLNYYIVLGISWGDGLDCWWSRKLCVEFELLW